MKTTTQLFIGYGNTGLVQINADPQPASTIKPGGPEMKNGGLVISEANESGVVNKLCAVNNTGSFLLLTDADVLTGARQNRIINKSVLLAPFSKTIIDVSCIERLRWSYNSKNFSSPGTAADHDLRKAKISSFMMRESCEPAPGTQGTVWSHINSRLREEHFNDKTESYHELVSFHMNQTSEDFPKFEAAEGCNGIGVVVDGEIRSIDIFASEALFGYYFPLLRDAAFRMSAQGKKIKQAEKHESSFRVLEAIDIFEEAERKSDSQYTGAGLFSMAEKDNILGFELILDRQLVHEAIFNK